MPPTKRTRRLINRSDSSTFERTAGTNPANRGKGFVRSNLGGIQETVSEGHDWPLSRASGDDVGGDFYTVKRTFNDDRAGEANSSPLATVRWSLGSAAGNMEYHGPLYALQMNEANFDSLFPLPTDFASNRDTLEEMGTTAISIVKPTNSVAELSTLLGETLREGLPKLPGVHTWKDRHNAAVNASGEYLNYAFGIAPVIRDIKDLTKAIKHGDEIVAQYERDAGRNVRRQFHYPEVRTVSDIVSLSGRAPYPCYSGPKGFTAFRFSGNNPIVGAFPADAFSPAVLNQGTRHFQRVIEKKTWFSGAFTYHLPSDSTAWGKMRRSVQELEKVYGIGIDPSTIYNLTPWSWALDWFTNTGDVVDNMSDYLVHGLVMRYGYVMETAVCHDTYTLTGHNLRGFGGPISCTFTTEVKQRIRATPFGFGLNWDGFDPFQLSIIAALGITRAGR